MNIEQLRAKLEDMDYTVVHAIWDEHCNQEPLKQWQLISEIIEIVESDEDVFKVVKDTVLSSQANGFHNTPAECEDVGCEDCPFDVNAQKSRGCPYVGGK